jgi:hypothetical protein
MNNETMLWVQTIAQVILAFITGWTLRVLIGYAADTKAIAKNSSEQIESSQLPFIALVESGERGDTPWAIKNLGKGPALNVSYSRVVNNSTAQHRVSPLAPSAAYHVTREDEDLSANDGFKVEYQSLSGRKYRTTVKKTNGERVHTFKEIA